MKLSSRRLALASVIVLLAVVDSFWVTTSVRAAREDYLTLAGPMLCTLVILFALIITPPMATRVTVTILFIGSWAFAVVLAGMYVSCDPGMDPFLPEMIVLFFPLAALTQPGFLAAAFGLAALIAVVAYHISRRFRHAIPIVFPTAAAVLVPVVFFVAESVFRLLGGHSTPGNCVL